MVVKETYTKSWVVRLIVLNVAIFIFHQIIFSVVGLGDQPVAMRDIITNYFGLRPISIVENFYVWQLFTYMFLHGGFFHLFLNMYALLIFGIPVEQTWGSRRFLIYYLFTGVGAGITIFTINFLLGGTSYLIPTIGASGAVFGLLLAFGMLFPDAEILIFFLIPLRAKFLVFIYGGLELYSLISSGGSSPISHAGHLGGLLFGIIYFVVMRKRGISFKSKLIKARLNREIDRRETKQVQKSGETEILLKDILRKIMADGPNALNDDEYQLIKYTEIMMQDVDDLCVDEDFDIDEDYCSKCKNREACLLRRIKKYL
jgi:membrane associated rhomboid family serine protease